MPQVDLDPQTYAMVKAVAEKEGRLLKGVVRLAVESAYGAVPRGAEEAEHHD